MELNRKEMMDVVQMLKSSYRFMFIDDYSITAWYTWLKEYPAEEVKAGVRRWILSEEKEPTVAGIVESIRKCQADRRAMDEYYREDQGKCIHCKGTGLITWESPTKVRMGRPCRVCGMGRQNYPWTFLTKEEQKAFVEEELKHGRVIPKAYEMSKTAYLKYVYGEE